MRTVTRLLFTRYAVFVIRCQRRFSSGVEQLIRNERVISSNLISGSPFFEELYLLKLTNLGLLAKVTEGNVWAPLEVQIRPFYGNRCRYGFALTGVNHGKVQCIGSSLRL